MYKGPIFDGYIQQQVSTDRHNGLFLRNMKHPVLMNRDNDPFEQMDIAAGFYNSRDR